jgi:hypothetical protein
MRQAIPAAIHIQRVFGGLLMELIQMVVCLLSPQLIVLVVTVFRSNSIYDAIGIHHWGLVKFALISNKTPRYPTKYQCLLDLHAV